MCKMFGPEHPSLPLCHTLHLCLSHCVHRLQFTDQKQYKLSPGRRTTRQLEDMEGGLQELYSIGQVVTVLSVYPPLLLCGICGSRHPFVMCRYMGLENNFMQKHGTIMHKSSHNKNAFWCKVGLFHSLCFTVGVERVCVSAGWTVCLCEISTLLLTFQFDLGYQAIGLKDWI